jgi:DNA-binding NarL/FixJ family response regulator
VLDVNLPGMNGWQTADLIRARNPAALVILISMFEVADARPLAERVGARGFLLKTFLRITLAPAIRSVFEGGTAFSGL